jgi:hypothetical protein
MARNDQQTVANFKLWEMEMLGRSIKARLLHHAEYVYYFCRAYPAAWKEQQAQNK